MKALVYTQPHHCEWQDYQMPEPAEGEVVLQIEAVGICGSDMHAWHGHDPRRKPGLVLGHEFCGSVKESRANNISVGARYTGNPLITCGTCEYCLQGRNNLCANRTMVGMTRPGAFAEYMSIPASSLIAIPQQMPAWKAALTEPVATAWHAINISQRALFRPVHECKTLVIGGGAIGMLAALLLRHLGVAQLTVAEVNAKRRKDIEQAVSCKTINPLESPVEENSYHYVIDAVGAKPTRDTALAAIRPGGVIMHIGLQDWASEIDMRKLTLAEVTLMGAYTYTTADLQASVDGLDRGIFGDLGWVSSRPLAEGGKAFVDLDKGECGAKVILQP